jgi:hypothetical protein
MSMHFGVNGVEAPEIGGRVATGKAGDFRHLRRKPRAEITQN